MLSRAISHLSIWSLVLREAVSPALPLYVDTDEARTTGGVSPAVPAPDCLLLTGGLTAAHPEHGGGGGGPVVRADPGTARLVIVTILSVSQTLAQAGLHQADGHHQQHLHHSAAARDLEITALSPLQVISLSHQINNIRLRAGLSFLF